MWLNRRLHKRLLVPQRFWRWIAHRWLIQPLACIPQPLYPSTELPLRRRRHRLCYVTSVERAASPSLPITGLSQAADQCLASGRKRRPSPGHRNIVVCLRLPRLFTVYRVTAHYFTMFDRFYDRYQIASITFAVASFSEQICLSTPQRVDCSTFVQVYEGLRRECVSARVCVGTIFITLMFFFKWGDSLRVLIR